MDAVRVGSMLALTHFAIGLTGGLLIAPSISRLDNSSVPILSGIWALGPDINKFIPQLDFLHDSVWSNIFWFHPTFDSLETSFPNIEAFSALVLLLFTVILLEGRYHNG